jgi:putative sterol carrier protein
VPPKRAPANTDAIEAFFTEISTRGQIPVLGSLSGSIRFDLVGDDGDVEPWYVDLTKGEAVVSHKKGKADATVRCDKRLMEQIAKGKKNAMAAVLRGAVVPDGDLSVIIGFQRLFPGRAGSTGRVPPIAEVAQDR